LTVADFQKLFYNLTMTDLQNLFYNLTLTDSQNLFYKLTMTDFQNLFYNLTMTDFQNLFYILTVTDFDIRISEFSLTLSFFWLITISQYYKFYVFTLMCALHLVLLKIIVTLLNTVNITLIKARDESCHKPGSLVVV
jgi:hypothetical protein